LISVALKVHACYKTTACGVSLAQLSVSFDRFELHPAARLLLADGQPVALGGRAFDLLCALVEGRDRVVTKSELLDLAWPGLVVEENNLTVQISALRKVLGKDAISTVAGRGYRFTLTVAPSTVHSKLGPIWEAGGSAVAGLFETPDLDARWLQGQVALGDLVVVLAVAGLASADAASHLTHAAEGAEAKWRWMRGEAAELVRRHGGSVIDAQNAFLLAEFPAVRAAVACSVSLKQSLQHQEWPSARFARIGLAPRAQREASGSQSHATSQLGHDVPQDLSLVLSLAEIADPAEVWATATVRDSVTDALDCHVKDLGEVQLPSEGAKLRVYEIRSTEAEAALPGGSFDARALKPVLAVLPFESRQSGLAVFSIGELIADGLIAMLSHASHVWRVVSRLSTTAFRGRTQAISEAQICLGAAYVISGSYAEDQGRLLVTLQVVDSRSGEVALARRVSSSVADLLGEHSQLLATLIDGIQHAIHATELQRVQSAPLPTLQSYTLLLGSIQMLHRSTMQDFELSHKLLAHLIQCHPKAVDPLIWQAKWYAMRAVQGLTTDLAGDAKAALTCTRRALDREPTNAFALAMEGFVHAHLTRDHEAARQRLQQSVAQNPSETFGHLFLGVVQGMTGEFQAGLRSYEAALATSPRDPARYLMDTIGGYLYLACGQLPEAIRLTKESLRQNRNHAHSWRQLTIAQQEAGAFQDAQQSLSQVLELQPDLTVSRYLVNVKSDDAVRHRFAKALQAAGLPAR
jgi:DNA-binding winged helix-turn-helix (wHTH) protein/TolB-like protein/Flp pilus assembly protein TadD